MPITQDRMIALIRAAQDFEQALVGGRQHVAAGIANVIALLQADRGQEAFEELTSMTNYLSNHLLVDPIGSYRTLYREVDYFKTKRQHNDKERLRQANRRAKRSGQLPTDNLDDDLPFGQVKNFPAPESVASSKGYLVFDGEVMDPGGTLGRPSGSEAPASNSTSKRDKD